MVIFTYEIFLYNVGENINLQVFIRQAICIKTIKNVCILGTAIPFHSLEFILNLMRSQKISVQCVFTQRKLSNNDDIE